MNDQSGESPNIRNEPHEERSDLSEFTVQNESTQQLPISSLIQSAESQMRSSQGHHQIRRQPQQATTQEIKEIKIEDSLERQQELSNSKDGEQKSDQVRQNLQDEELKSMQQQITSNRVFLDMVVHDMRNPTSSIEFGLKETLKALDKYFDTFKDLKMQWMLTKNTHEELKVPKEEPEDESQSSSDEQIQEQLSQRSQRQPRRAQIQQQSIEEVIINEEEYESICDEFDDNIKEVHIPKNLEQVNAKNYKLMKGPGEVGEPNIIDRVVLVSAPHVNQIERFVQASPKTSNASTQTNLKMKKLEKMIEKSKAKTCSRKCELAHQMIRQLDKMLETDIRTNATSMIMNCVSSASIVTGLINDILDLAKLETSQINFNNDYFNLRDAINSAIHQVEYLARERNITITQAYIRETETEEERQNRSSLIEPEFDFRILSCVYGDSRRIIQVIYNFLSNAIKFSLSNGNVSIIVRLVEEQEVMSDLAQEALKNVIEHRVYSSKSQQEREQVLQIIQKSEQVQKSIQDQQVMLLNHSLQKRQNHSFSLTHLLQKKQCITYEKSILDYVRDHSQQHNNNSLLNKPTSPVSSNNMREQLENSPFANIKRQSTPNMVIPVDQNKNWLSKAESSSVFINTQSIMCLDSILSERYLKFQIDIKDDGVGIKEENLKKLFMNFSMLNEHSKMNAQGTGLGLSICKKIVEQMGGTVSVKSKQNVGTTFSVTLAMKAKIVQVHQQSSDKQVSVRNLNLIVGNNSRSFSSGQSSSNLLNRARRGPIETDSSEEGIITRKSSLPQIEEVKQGRIVNFPQIGQNRLRDQLTCIVVNDDQFQLMAAAYNLEALNIKILKRAFNGLEAVQFLKENLTKQIDFILLDLEMPIMNGFDACKQIKSLYFDSLKHKKTKSGKQVGPLPQNQIKVRCSLEDSNSQYSFDDANESQNSQNVKGPQEDLACNLQKCPMLVAFSGLINQSVLNQGKESGFDVMIENPLTQQKIQDHILKAYWEMNFKNELARQSQASNQSGSSRHLKSSKNQSSSSSSLQSKSLEQKRQVQQLAAVEIQEQSLEQISSSNVNRMTIFNVNPVEEDSVQLSQSHSHSRSVSHSEDRPEPSSLIEPFSQNVISQIQQMAQPIAGPISFNQINRREEFQRSEQRQSEDLETPKLPTRTKPEDDNYQEEKKENE